MGWKLAIALFSMGDRSLENAVSDFYGNKRSLMQTNLSVDDILDPKNDKIAYATSMDNLAWIFDWPSVIKILDDGYDGTESVSFYLLHSVVNLYGFAKYENGKEIRRKSGSSDGGIHIDNGSLLPGEREEVSRIAGPVSEKLLGVWQDPEKIVKVGDYEYTHDTLGEEIVFALMQANAGFRFDRVSKKTDTFSPKLVQEISRRAKFFDLF